MEDRQKLILEFMAEENYVPMRAKEIAMMMEVPKTDMSEFMEVLSSLEDEYKIQKNRKSKYSLVDNSLYLTGKYRGNEKGFGFVKVEGLDEDIYISKENSKDTLNGDIVVIEIYKGKSTKGHEEGRIIKVVKREKNTIVGTFTNSKSFGFVVPDDRKLGTDIFISKKNIGKARTNDKVVVEILKYPENNKNAEGKIVEILGKIDEAGVDMLSLIKEHDLPEEFPEDVINEAKEISEKIPEREIKNRLDLRKEEIFTIDGEDAKDLDDAVQVIKLENGNYKLGVHIADVSHYVKEGSKLDKEAIYRGTSIYMLDRVIPMLPKELSNGICSLNAGKDRLSLSVIMEINQNGEVVSSDIQKTVINVTRRMSYSDVARILKYTDNSESDLEEESNDVEEANRVAQEKTKDLKVVTEYREYIEHFKRMEELAKILKDRRAKQGSLNLDIPETKIILDENGFAIQVKQYELSFANEIIEQFMLTANETVAERFFWLEAPFIYRVHEEPDEDRVKELNQFLLNFKYRIKVSKDNIHPKAFAEVLNNIKGKEEERVISTLILRTLKIARYEAQNKGHFGIASEYYSHFTSPIRRYPDLFIHRIISKYIEHGYNVSEEFKDKYNGQALVYAEQSSEREKLAQKAERDSVDIKTAEYMQNKIGEEYDAIVSSVTSFGMFAQLDNTIEGLIRFDNMGNEYYTYDDNKKALIGEKTKKTYTIGSKVKIRVISANKILRQIDFALIEE